MRTLNFRPVAIAAAALLSASGAIAAQEKPTGLLNALEVRQLVARANPEDNTRLSAHFSALADRYAAEAKRHTSMSQSFTGNPNRNLSAGMSAHCTRLADLGMKSATVARELAVYHGKLANSTAAAAPRGGARLQAGAGAPQPTEGELRELAAKAATGAEHHALHEYFLTLSARSTSEAGEHVALAQSYRGTRLAQAAADHDRLATLAREASKEAAAAAEQHKGLAGLAR